MFIDTFVILLMVFGPFATVIGLAKYMDYSERKARNERINNFKFEEFNTWED